MMAPSGRIRSFWEPQETLQDVRENFESGLVAAMNPHPCGSQSGREDWAALSVPVGVLLEAPRQTCGM
jgi:hypothetical protein